MSLAQCPVFIVRDGQVGKSAMCIARRVRRLMLSMRMTVAGVGASSGMAKPFAIQFYKSKAWQKCRAAYIQSVFGLCEKCGRPGWIVHHKIKLTPANINDPNVTLNWDSLEYLC